MTPNALSILRELRRSTRCWHTIPELRRVVGASPSCLGEPVVYPALREIRRAGIRIEEGYEQMSDDPRVPPEAVYRVA